MEVVNLYCIKNESISDYSKSKRTKTIELKNIKQHKLFININFCRG